MTILSHVDVIEFLVFHIQISQVVGGDSLLPGTLLYLTKLDLMCLSLQIVVITRFLPFRVVELSSRDACPSIKPMHGTCQISTMEMAPRSLLRGPRHNLTIKLFKRDIILLPLIKCAKNFDSNE